MASFDVDISIGHTDSVLVLATSFETIWILGFFCSAASFDVACNICQAISTGSTPGDSGPWSAHTTGGCLLSLVIITIGQCFGMAVQIDSTVLTPMFKSLTVSALETRML
jgi:hypothetical protein